MRDGSAGGRMSARPGRRLGDPMDDDRPDPPRTSVGAAVAAAAVGRALPGPGWVQLPRRTDRRLAVLLAGFVGLTALYLATLAQLENLGLGTAVAGLVGVPADAQWLLARAAWLPVLGVLLALACAAVRRFERPGLRSVELGEEGELQARGSFQPGVQ